MTHELPQQPEAKNAPARSPDARGPLNEGKRDVRAEILAVTDPAAAVSLPQQLGAPLARDRAFAEEFSARTGLAAEDILHRPLPVTLLRRHGYALLNAVGDGSRSIVQEVGGRNFRDKAFLTDDDVAFIRAQVAEGLDDATLGRIGDDMRAFIRQCTALEEIHRLLTPRQCRGGAFLNAVMVEMSEAGYPPERRLDAAQREVLVGKVCEMVRAALPDLPERLRGIPVGNMQRRREGAGIAGKRSPLLSDATVLRENQGIKLRLDDAPDAPEYRLNDLVAHLAAHGICNTGKPEDPTQRYLTIREYLPLFRQAGDAHEETALTGDLLAMQWRAREVLARSLLTHALDALYPDAHARPPQDVIDAFLAESDGLLARC